MTVAASTNAIKDGTEQLVLWMSITASRSPEMVKNPTWEGRVFVHGIFFAHEPEVVPKDLKPLHLEKPMHKPGTTNAPQGWIRP